LREIQLNKSTLLVASATVWLAACGATAPKADSAAAPAPAKPAVAVAPAQATPPSGVQGQGGKAETAGNPVGTGKFAALKAGMQMSEVQNIMDRAPDRSHTYESGKRWIPFYFGNDARRMQALFRGEGCLIFTDGNVWGGAGGELVEIQSDASGACYQP
jgi:hypothetical protein